jgi:hypothetical protein
MDKTKKGTNIGCPYAPEEQAHFAKMLKLGNPKITDKEVAVVIEAFKAAAVKDGFKVGGG